jgi:LytS/YehU family sensor histidine kinase
MFWKRLILILPLLALSLMGKAYNVDSLLQLLNTSGNNNAERYNTLAEQMQQDRPGESMQYARKALQLAGEEGNACEEARAREMISGLMALDEKTDSALFHLTHAILLREKSDDYVMLARNYNNTGLLYFRQNNYREALRYYRNALVIKEKLDDKRGQGISLINMANACFYLGNYDLALQYYQQSLALFEEIGLKPGIANALNGCGLVYENMANYNKALDFYNKALKAMEELGAGREVANIYNNMGNVWSKMHDLTEAKKNYEMALHKRKEIGDQNGIAGSFNNLGIVSRKAGDYEVAISYFNRALQINRKTGNVHEQSLNLHAIGKVFQLKGNRQKALEYIGKSLELAKKTGSLTMIHQNYQLYSEIYEALQQPVQALRYYKLAASINDSLFDAQTRNEIANLQTRFETREKQHQIELLTKENEISALRLNRNRLYIITLVLFLVFVVITGILFIRQQRMRAYQRTILLEHRLLRSQMNPHFMFNTLNTLQNLIFEKDKMKALKYLSSFAMLLRLILENSREEFVLFEKELKTMQNYLELQKTRYNQKFDYTIDIDENINEELISVPPMLSQPFIENSIKHGILNKEGKGHIRLAYRRQDGHIICTISDDGIGLKKAAAISKTDEEEHISLSTAITRERLQLLNRNKKIEEIIAINDLKKRGGEGTEVVFTFPFKTK